MSYFDAFGPFEVNRDTSTVSGRQKSFWQDIESRWDGLGRAIGCYVFCIARGDKLRPWYVGMTVAKTGFKGEIFQAHKLNIYKDCLRKQKGRPVMFFFPLMKTNTGHFSKAYGKKKEIQWLEITLMGFAHRQNPEISNIRDMTFLRNIEVLGLIGKRRGRPFREAVAVRNALLGARKSP